MYLRADSGRCSGCRACLLACSLHLFGENNPKAAALAIVPHFPSPGTFEVRTCTQCGACADACPTGAIAPAQQGIYAIDSAACTGCLACQTACPEGVLLVRAGQDAPLKCDACGDCIAFCGTTALTMA